MNKKKKERLEAAGFKIGTVREFLGINKEEPSTIPNGVLEELARETLERASLIADAIEDDATIQLMEVLAHAVLQYLGKEEA